jgi:hypothetical protein
LSDLPVSRYQDQRSAPKKWTVMVYMAAQGVEGEAKSLFDEAESDIKEMEAVPKSDTLNVLYQLHGKGRPERCHVGHGGREAFDENPADATTGRSLANFVLWALATAGHSGPGDHSLLVLWGHAYRFGIGNAVTPDGIDAIDFAELTRVLRETQREIQRLLRMEQTPKLDVIAFDACDIATVEAAVQVAEFADYMLASQVGIPLPGWPYTRILERLAKQQGDRLMGPPEFGSYAVRRFCETYQADDRAVSLTMLDLKNTPRLFELTEALARELAIAADGDDGELAGVIEMFRRSQTTEDKPFVDVADLCLNLLRHSGHDRVRQAAKRLGDFLVSPGPVVPGRSETGAGRPLVMEHGSNGAEMARLRGISLYAPHVVNGGYDWIGALHWYEKFVFAKETLWNELVRALVQETE